MLLVFNINETCCDVYPDNLPTCNMEIRVTQTLIALHVPLMSMLWFNFTLGTIWYFSLFWCMVVSKLLL